MSKHEWNEWKSAECQKCGILNNWGTTIDCDEIVRINATHKWEIINGFWVCARCKFISYSKDYVPIAGWKNQIKTCAEIMMERVLK